MGTYRGLIMFKTLCILLLFANQAFAAEQEFAWLPNDASNLTGYRILYGIDRFNLDQTEEVKGFFARWLHRADLDEQTSLFLEFTTDRARERLLTGEPDFREDEFEGERDYYQFRVETHWD